MAMVSLDVFTSHEHYVRLRRTVQVFGTIRVVLCGGFRSVCGRLFGRWFSVVAPLVDVHAAGKGSKQRDRTDDREDAANGVHVALSCVPTTPVAPILLQREG